MLRIFEDVISIIYFSAVPVHLAYREQFRWYSWQQNLIDRLIVARLNVCSGLCIRWLG